MIPNIIQTLKEKKLYVLSALAIIALLVISLFLIPEPSGTKTPKANEISQIATPAVIVDGQDLYAAINNDVMYRNLRADLAQFARNTLKIESEPITFEVSSDVKNESADISFSGFFSDKKGDKLTIVLTKKSNDRFALNVSIKDKDYSGDFTANNKRSEFIATLPQSTSDFEIVYDNKEEQFIVNLYERSQAAQQRSQDYLKQQLGVDNLDGESIQYIFPTFDDATAPTEDTGFDSRD